MSLARPRSARSASLTSRPAADPSRRARARSRENALLAALRSALVVGIRVPSDVCGRAAESSAKADMSALGRAPSRVRAASRWAGALAPRLPELDPSLPRRALPVSL
jgi:hypothetical protein